MLNVSAEELHQVKEILNKFVPWCEVRAYGSRFKGTNRKFSDLDLALVGTEKLDWKLLCDVRLAFEESELSFSVDVLDWHAISEEFREVISAGYEVIKLH